MDANPLPDDTRQQLIAAQAAIQALLDLGCCEASAGGAACRRAGQKGGITASLQALLIGPSAMAVPSSFGGLVIEPSLRCPPRSVASSSGLLGGALLVR